jgi:methyl-accepting chemotaxis protein
MLSFFYRLSFRKSLLLILCIPLASQFFSSAYIGWSDYRHLDVVKTSVRWGRVAIAGAELSQIFLHEFSPDADPAVNAANTDKAIENLNEAYAEISAKDGRDSILADSIHAIQMHLSFLQEYRNNRAIKSKDTAWIMEHLRPIALAAIDISRRASEVGIEREVSNDMRALYALMLIKDENLTQVLPGMTVLVAGKTDEASLDALRQSADHISLHVKQLESTLPGPFKVRYDAWENSNQGRSLNITLNEILASDGKVETSQRIVEKWADGVWKRNATQEKIILDLITSIKAKLAADLSGAENALLMTISINLLAYLLVSLLAWKIVSVLSAIIRHLAARMESLANGETAAAIPYLDRDDEMGSIAKSIRVFQHAILTNRQQENHERDRAAEEAARMKQRHEDEALARRQLTHATSALGEGLRKLANGDLSIRIEDAFAPDFEMLRHDFNQSLAQLGQVLAAISASIATMDNGIREIASGAGDLSRRTEHQASSIEQTAAALEEITVNVKSSAKRTAEARAVATNANQSALQSAEVVGHAEEAMQRIEHSSQQISNIIGVIDEIAFQTNLLALNAGVEAARAGDAGKGFAVVAQEVRELAQRSAGAAKEIKSQIRNSSQEVEIGVKLVRDTGEALKMIGGYIAQINTHMDSIATAAKEQSLGLAEVNIAVNSMDQSTQQNAAMVEQSTAASSSLAMEAAKLRDLVSQFKLDGGVSLLSQGLRRTAHGMEQPSTQATTPRGAAIARGNEARSHENWAEARNVRIA